MSVKELQAKDQSMTQGMINVDERLYQYILDRSLRETGILEKARKETLERSDSNMMISAPQGQFLYFLVKLMSAGKAIEIGTYTGYSALWIGLGLQEEGELITCDHDPDITQKAREYWKEAGLAHKISLRVGPAISALDRLISEGGEGAYDFVFIDADKTEYEEYYERSMVLIRSGGLITVDNTLWYGRVADGEVNDEDTVALRKFNENLHRDDRVHISLLPMSDGLTLALKK